MKIRHWAAAIALGIVAAADAGAMTVDQAYSQLKHRRTVFDASKTRVPQAQQESLRRLFSIAELGTVLKVRAYNAHASGDKAGYAAVMKDYESLVAVSKRQPPPVEIKPVHDLVVGAIAGQRGVLAASASKAPTVLSRKELERNPDVQKVHRDLLRAYNLLLATFPQEPAVNRDAFYDYLCALDFL
jgi:hypothetical protein